MAIIQSAATGNANAGATWVGGVVPGTGDTFEVLTGHTVTFTANMTVLGWTQKGSGRLILNAGVVLTATAGPMTVEGDAVDNAKVVLAAGARLMANPATGVTVTLRIGTDYFRYAEVESRGTEGSRCKIGLTTGAAGTFDIRHGQDVIWMQGLFDCEYTDFLGVGTFEMYPRYHGKIVLKNCDVTGVFTGGGYNLKDDANTGLLQFEDTVFRGNATFSGNNGRSDVMIQRCEFIGDISFLGGVTTDSLVTFYDSVLNSRFLGGWDGVSDIKGLFMYQRDIGKSTGHYPFAAKYVDCYAFADYFDNPASDGNPHFFAMGNAGKTMRLEGCVIEYRGPEGIDTGDALDLHAGNAEFVRSIVLPANADMNVSGLASGVLWFLGGTGMLDIDHSTIYSPGNAVQFPHNVPMAANQARVRNSLFWTNHSDMVSYAILNDSPGTSDVDALPPGNIVGNAFFGMADGMNTVGGVANTPINGMKDLELSALPTGNVSFPARGHQMTDYLACIYKWGRSRGIGGTNDEIIAGAIAQLKADRTLTRTSLVPFVKSGMTPGNMALSTAAADGTTPGISNVAAPLSWTAWPDSLAAWHARNQPKSLTNAQYLIDQATIRQTSGVDNGEVALTYYDSQRVYQNLAQEYPANATLYHNAAEASYYLYVETYLAPNGWGAPGHWNFTTGLKMMFDRLGTPKYRDAVFELSTKAAFAQDGVTTINGSIDGARENAYALISHLNARLLGQAPRTITETRIQDLWLQSQEVLDGVLLLPGNGVDTFGGVTLQSFMVAILVEAFHMVYDDSTDPAYRASIVARCQELLDHTWEDKWRPQSGWFYYGTDDSFDLNLYIVPAYAWIWHKTGNVRNRDRYDMAFSHGAAQGWLDGMKQYNQQNIKTREGIHYRTIAVNTSTEVEGPEVVSTYTLTGPTGGYINTVSGTFTVTIGSGTLAGTVRFTPQSSGGTGVFVPTFLDLTDSVRSGTFTYIPSSLGSRVISSPDNGGLTDPGGIAFEAVAQPVEPPSPNQSAPFIPGDSVVMIGGVGGERTLIIPWDGKK